MRQKTAAEALVEEYRPFVQRIAQRLKRRVGHYAEMDDLMQAGMEGLIEATPRYNPESGASFTTFVSKRIRGAMYDMLRKDDWAPRPVSLAARDIADGIRKVELREQRPAREAEVANHMGITLAKYREMVQETTAHHVFSMEEAQEAADIAACPRPNPEDEAEAAQFNTRLRVAIATLPERQRRVIEWTREGMSLLEAGKILGVTESRACQLRTQGMEALRAAVHEGSFLMPAALICLKENCLPR